MRAPPPMRAATMPPTSEPAPQMPSSGPATAGLPSASAAATTATSTVPNTTPSASRTSTSVRMAGARSEPPRGRVVDGTGRHARDAGWAAKTAVAATSTAAARASAAPVDHAAATSRTTGGPETQVSSIAADSAAYARCSASRSPMTAGRIARRHAPTGGALSPSTAASATGAASGAPAGSAAVAASAEPATSAPATRTVVCPRRSTSRPSSGPPTPSAAPNAPATMPAAPSEPVSRSVWTSSPMLSIAIGRRAITETAMRRRAPGAEVREAMAREARTALVY